MEWSCHLNLIRSAIWDSCYIGLLSHSIGLPESLCVECVNQSFRVFTVVVFSLVNEQITFVLDAILIYLARFDTMSQKMTQIKLDGTRARFHSFEDRN